MTQERGVLLDSILWAVKQVSDGVYSVREIHPSKETGGQMVYYYNMGYVARLECEGCGIYPQWCVHREAVKAFLAKGDKLQPWPLGGG